MHGSTDDGGGRPLRWGIIGTGGIARRFALDLAGARTGRLVAVASRRPETAARFVAEFPGVRAHGSYQALLGDGEVDAVYLATPHTAHHEWALQVLMSGKHLLCEKPLTLNREMAQELVDTAEREQRFLMETFMYRCHPQTDSLVKLIQSGAIGMLQRIEAKFCVNFPYDPAHRLFDLSLGGGAILDLGCYPVSFARRMAGADWDESFANPIGVTARGTRHPEAGCDVAAEIELRFEGDIVAELACATQGERAVFAKLHGTDGWIDVPTPYCPGFEGQPDWVLVHRPGEDVAKIHCRADRPLYALEADVVGRAVEAAQLESEAMTWADTLGNLAVLDAWREAAGVRYPGE